MPQLIEGTQEAIHKYGQGHMVHEGVGWGGGVTPMGSIGSRTGCSCI